MKLYIALLLIGWSLSSASVAAQETESEAGQESPVEYEIDLEELEKEIEKKPYRLGGFLEFESRWMFLDRESVFYKLRFPHEDRETLGWYDFGLRLEGGYEKGAVGIYFTGDSALQRDHLGWKGEVSLFQGYLSLKLNPNLTLDAGKKVTKWGKGYAWNPVAFFDRPKDPEDPQEALEGFYIVSADFVKSFDSPLRTLAFTPVIVPVTDNINSEFGRLNHVNFGGKLYFLLWDTDIDFLFLSSSSRTSRYGVDFSKNLRTNFEVHGEWAWITEFTRATLGQDITPSPGEETVLSMLLGVRYLTSSELTIIAEYYRNGEGLLQEDVQGFYDAPPGIGSDAPGEFRERVLFQENLTGPNFMRDYLFFRTSRREPWGILYFTPEITSIVNAGDGSFTLIPGFTYSPKTNLNVRLRGAILAGNRQTEYGEKQSDFRVELRVRYFF